MLSSMPLLCLLKSPSTTKWVYYLCKVWMAFYYSCQSILLWLCPEWTDFYWYFLFLLSFLLEICFLWAFRFLPSLRRIFCHTSWLCRCQCSTHWWHRWSGWSDFYYCPCSTHDSLPSCASFLHSVLLPSHPLLCTPQSSGLLRKTHSSHSILYATLPTQDSINPSVTHCISQHNLPSRRTIPSYLTFNPTDS